MLYVCTYACLYARVHCVYRNMYVLSNVVETVVVLVVERGGGGAAAAEASLVTSKDLHYPPPLPKMKTNQDSEKRRATRAFAPSNSCLLKGEGRVPFSVDLPPSPTMINNLRLLN